MGVTKKPGTVPEFFYPPPVPPFQGLGCFVPTNPRAALRFALGYPLAPRWGIKPEWSRTVRSMGATDWKSVVQGDQGYLAQLTDGRKTKGNTEITEITE